LPFRANRDCPAPAYRRRTLTVARLAASLLPPINDRLNFHQTHEGAAEAARAGIAEAQGDIREPLVRLDKQVTGRFETNLRNNFTVAGTNRSEMTLQ
jgi:hypothetical protein